MTGFIVQSAGDARGALEILTQDRADVVMLDLGMRRRHELLRALRLREVDVAAIVVVAAADVASAHAAVREGAAGYLTKPLDAVALVLGVERALETRALRREIEALRARREQLAVEARRSLHAREALLSTVAHDVRAQLAAVTMVTSSLARGVLTDEHRKKLALVPRAVKRIERVVDDLLDIGRLEAGKLPLDLSLARASTLVDDVAGLLQPIAAERGVSVTTSVSDFDVRCARERIVQVLERLGSNAVRGTPRNGSVRLRAEPRDGRGWFAVEGGRPGRRSTRRRRAHTRPERGGSSQARQMGIDLAIAKRIIDAHGGSLEVESHAGGTTLRFDVAAFGTERCGGRRSGGERRLCGVLVSTARPLRAMEWVATMSEVQEEQYEGVVDRRPTVFLADDDDSLQGRPEGRADCAWLRRRGRQRRSAGSRAPGDGGGRPRGVARRRGAGRSDAGVLRPRRAERDAPFREKAADVAPHGCPRHCPSTCSRGRWGRSGVLHKPVELDDVLDAIQDAVLSKARRPSRA